MLGRPGGTPTALREKRSTRMDRLETAGSGRLVNGGCAKNKRAAPLIFLSERHRREVELRELGRRARAGRIDGALLRRRVAVRLAVAAVIVDDARGAIGDGSDH